MLLTINENKTKNRLTIAVVRNAMPHAEIFTARNEKIFLHFSPVL